MLTHIICVYRINHIGICVRERDQREPSFSKCCFLCSAFSPIYIFSESHVGWIFDCPLLLDFFQKIQIKSRSNSFYNINYLIISNIVSYSLYPYDRDLFQFRCPYKYVVLTQVSFIIVMYISLSSTFQKSIYIEKLFISTRITHLFLSTTTDMNICVLESKINFATRIYAHNFIISNQKL